MPQCACQTCTPTSYLHLSPSHCQLSLGLTPFSLFCVSELNSRDTHHWIILSLRAVLKLSSRKYWSINLRQPPRSTFFPISRPKKERCSRRRSSLFRLGKRPATFSLDACERRFCPDSSNPRQRLQDGTSLAARAQRRWIQDRCSPRSRERKPSLRPTRFDAA